MYGMNIGIQKFVNTLEPTATVTRVMLVGEALTYHRLHPPKNGLQHSATSI